MHVLLPIHVHAHVYMYMYGKQSIHYPNKLDQTELNQTQQNVVHVAKISFLVLLFLHLFGTFQLHLPPLPLSLNHWLGLVLQRLETVNTVNLINHL